MRAITLPASLPRPEPTRCGRLPHYAPCRAGEYCASISSTTAKAVAVAVKQDGKIYLGGHTTASSTSNFAVARLTSAGILDSTFDADGKLTTSFTGYTNDQINAVAILDDGKFLAVGQANSGGNNDFALARYNAPAGLEERVYVIQDANYNVTSITDTSGSVIEAYAYDPYGKRTIYALGYGSTRGSSSYSFDYGFQGGQYVSNAELTLFRHRFLSTSLQRWMQVDPLQYVDGMNDYTAFKSSPITYVDATGTDATKMPTPGDPIFLPVGRGDRGGSGFSGISFIQWSVHVPAGVAHYVFRWGTYDASNGRSLTGLTTRTADGEVKLAPGEKVGRSEYYFRLIQPTDFWLVNFAIGATGRKSDDVFYGGGHDLKEFIKWNNGQLTYGWESAEVEVRDLSCAPGDTLEHLKYDHRSYNNANRNYIGSGGIQSLPLAGDGLKAPNGCNKAKIIYDATADLTWYKGSYQFNWWAKDEAGKVTFGYRGGTL